MAIPFEFDPAAYPPACARLLAGDRLCSLGPGTPQVALRSDLQSLTPQSLLGDHPIVDSAMADACLAGLWLLHDFLDESHRISQGISTPTGSYWHGIMHRREPDYPNAKYWFHRVGDHPVFGQLQQAAARLAQQAPADSATGFLPAQAAWDPSAFVDCCQAVASGRVDGEQLCRQIARAEWELLFDYCFRKAIGG